MSLQISDQVQDVLDHEDITLPELEDMLTKAAITSLRGASRRFHQWLFEYNKDRHYVERMFLHQNGWDTATADSPHRECEGWGCVGCGWSGRFRLPYQRGSHENTRQAQARRAREAGNCN